MSGLLYRVHANHGLVHDADFRQSERDWHAFVDKLTEKLIDIDDTIPELPVKDVVGIFKHKQHHVLLL